MKTSISKKDSVKDNQKDVNDTPPCTFDSKKTKDALYKTVEKQIYQLFELFDEALKENLREVKVSYKGTIRNTSFKPISLPGLVELALKDIEENGDEGFSMKLNIYCYREITDDVQIWNTDTTLTYQRNPKHEINGIDSDKPYLEIEKEKLPLCESFTILQKRRVLNTIMFRIVKDYDIHYS